MNKQIIRIILFYTSTQYETKPNFPPTPILNPSKTISRPQKEKKENKKTKLYELKQENKVRSFCSKNPSIHLSNCVAYLLDTEKKNDKFEVKAHRNCIMIGYADIEGIYWIYNKDNPLNLQIKRR